MERIGVIGLGRMGREIARRMAAEGAQVSGWTRSGLSIRAAEEMGIAKAGDLAELVAASDVLVLSLFDDDAVRAVLDQLLTEELSGRLIIDTSTVSPKLLSGYVPRIASAGASAVDAPIAGGPEMVANGTCGVFIGGEVADFDRAKPVTDLISGRVMHTGALGAGMGMKIANNALIAGTIVAMDEILQIARGAGLEFEMVMRLVAGGPAGAPFLGQRMDKILGKDDSVGFPISGTLKDVSVFAGAAAELGVDAPMLSRAKEIMTMAANQGLAEHDAAALFRAAWDRV